MTNRVKIMLWSSVIFVVSIIFYQFVFFPTVEPANLKQTFQHPEILQSKVGSTIGSNEAKSTILIFTDYGCGACKLLEQSLYEIEKEHQYIKSGQLKVIYKDIPNHPNAREASLSALAARKQGKFQEMNKLLFEKQEEWRNANKEVFQSYASSIGLDLTEFKQDFLSDKLDEEIEQSVDEFQKLDSVSTPIIIMGDMQINGAPDKLVLLKLIQEQL